MVDPDLLVQSPVRFPLPGLDASTVHALHNAWHRQDLGRYLKRWEHGYVPDFPEPFWEYGWRACDVGGGFGLFSATESERHPERAYLCIDKGNRRGAGMLSRFHQTGRPNLFGLHANAIPVLAKMPANSLDLITIFYPNPWWPPKHQKKRWSFHSLVPQLIELLKPGGRLLLCANEGFYLAEWLYTMTHHPSAESMQEEYVGLIEVTTGRSHFEQKYIAHQIACGEIRFRKGD